VFFILSKLLDVALDPLWWAVSVVVGGLILLRRKPRAGHLLLGLGLAVLLIFSTPPVVGAMWQALERSAPRTFRPETTYDVVVLLGGVVDPSGSLSSEVAYGHNVERLLTVFDLLRTQHARQVILSGGRLGEGLPTEAVFLRDQLLRWGIEPERLVLEEGSKNTHENAVNTAALMQSRPGQTMLVVTSAFHMQRAAGCFTAAGLTFDTLPVDYRVREPSRDNSLLPRSEYLADATRALRELSGRVVYRVLGYSKQPW